MNQPIDTTSQQPIKVIVVNPSRRWLITILILMLVGSLFVNLTLSAMKSDFTTETNAPTEKFHSGDSKATDKIARIVTDFTIMPPHTDRLLKIIEHVQKKVDVKGVLLVIDSPGGLVSDSHEIYHKLLKLSEKKPIHVYMKGIAASGGYYIAMGAGEGAPIYAEPTTWTGSIGVIMPRYDVSELANKFGIKPDSLATGPLKDTLNPLKELSEAERKVWMTILDDSFNRFLKVIDDSRANLNMDQVKALATGQVYTAQQALDLGLIDKIGYEEDVVAALKEKLGLTSVKVINYESQKSLAEILVGAQAASVQTDPLTRVLDANVPRAMYLFGWPATPSYMSTY
ncbi:signal peptide peptidase SppA [Planctomicrobium sp. SH527]|uniref:signal peptide peptidase SppA n=1 Tax=Planctomicrobium sp. SH527 TaxID=3448123 RepID=UPI003F5CAB2F